MSEPVLIPGVRDVRGVLSDPGTGSRVVACPPHPRMGGTRSDQRLRAVSNRLTDSAVGSLRFDYGEWDDGHGERTDVINAVRWATERFDRVGLFGYSFGGTLALLAGAEIKSEIECISALAPDARISDELDAVAALDEISVPVGIVYGERDSTVAWQPVVNRARACDHDIVSMSADHFFIGQTESVAKTVVEFVTPHV